MAIGPQASAVDVAVVELMALRRRNICEGLLRDLLRFPGSEVQDTDHERYYMLWLATRALTAVANADMLLLSSRACAAVPIVSALPGTGSDGASCVDARLLLAVDSRSAGRDESVAAPVVRRRSPQYPLVRGHTLRRLLTAVRLLIMVRFCGNRPGFGEFLLTGKALIRRVIHPRVAPRANWRRHSSTRTPRLVIREPGWRLSGRSEIAQRHESNHRTDEGTSEPADRLPRIPVPRLSGRRAASRLTKGAQEWLARERNERQARSPGRSGVTQAVRYRSLTPAPV